MKSIRRHLTITLVVTFGVLLAVSGSAIYVFTRVALVREFDAALRARALAIMTQTEQSSGGFQLELSPALRQEFDDAGVRRCYQLWRTNGTTVARSESLRGANLPFHFGPPTHPKFWNLDLPHDEDARAIGVEFQPKPEDEDRLQTPPTMAILVVAENREHLDKTLATLAGVLAATGLLALIVTIPMVRLSVRRGHAPLDELADQAASITAHSLQVRFPVEGLPEELRPISIRLNDVLQRLEASFERERRFSADLAHELRTPLAELRTQAEVAIQFAEGQSTEAHRDTLAIALQMQGIVTSLLDLARSENGKIPLKIESVSVADLANEVWRPLAAPAREKNLSIQFDIPEDAKIQTEIPLYRSILANLFSNAVTYTPPGGKVEIKWHARASELAVSNTVDDLRPEDAPHLFERLWRKDKSRTGAEHHGLGLAVSRAFANVLGLKLTARFTGESTLTLFLTH